MNDTNRYLGLFTEKASFPFCLSSSLLPDVTVQGDSAAVRRHCISPRFSIQANWDPMRASDSGRNRA